MNVTGVALEHDEHERHVEDRKWHLQRDFPLSVIATLIIQTAAMVWSVSSLYSRVDTLVESFREMKSERYSREDARRDKELIGALMQSMQQRDIDIERRISALESRETARVHNGK